MRFGKILIGAALAASMLLAAAAVQAQDVAQGKCLSFDKAAKTLTLDEYDTNFSKENPYGKSTGIETTFDLAGAKIGLEPEAGNILRIAYMNEGEKKAAVKVMNITKQDLKK